MISPVRLVIHRRGESPVYGEDNTEVRLEDEGAGPFLVLSQQDGDLGTVRLDLEELELLPLARDLLLPSPAAAQRPAEGLTQAETDALLAALREERERRRAEEKQVTKPPL